VITNPAMAPLNLDSHLADHARAVDTTDKISALYCAVSFLVHGDITLATTSLARLDDDVVALAASVGVQLSILAEQVLADRANPYHLSEDQGGFPVGAGRRRAL
jgi:hypothetical protein